MQQDSGCHDTPINDQLRAVLDAVRDTGMSAHPKPGQAISDVVMLVAIDGGWNPVALQAQVRAYADGRPA